ncbi:DUF2523 domain-containing protein [Vibrio kyushuensis]|uniref:DUF2523 domain-containing protein n=1 Tax=Vibrio kyushuensis TaxID=2910249 RepID=UPI003D11B353
MDWIIDIFNFFGDGLDSIINFINSTPTMFEDIITYMQLWYIKMQFTIYISFLKISYQTAQLLLEEIGFNDVLVSTFNLLPDELRYYAHAFGLPKAIATYINFFTTGFVMRFSK